MEGLEAVIGLGITLGLLVLGYVAGRRSERIHYVDIRARERSLVELPALTLSRVLAQWEAERAEMVTGVVVISLDYFKRFVAGLRGLVGGRVKAYEPLLDRGRREAMLRMKEQARDRGYDAVINVRLETSRLASGGANGKGTAGVEILAYGTAIKRR